MPFSGESAESYYDEGITASMRGDLARATECFETAIRKDSTMASAYQQLGRVYSRMARHREAVSLLNQVVSKRPDQVPPLIDLGNALLGAGKPSEARQSFQHALTIDSSNAKAALGLAQAEYDGGDWAQAAMHAQQALTVGGSTFPVVYLLGRAAHLAGDFEASKRSLQRADDLMEKYLEMNPDKPEGHYLRGELAFFQRGYAKALDHYRSAQGFAEEGRSYIAYGEVFTQLDVLAKQGLCLQNLSELEQAKAIGQRVLKADPNHKIGRALAAIDEEA